MMNPANLDPNIANKVLHLAQEWGEFWTKPTQPRAAKLYPELTAEQLDEYDRAANQAMRLGHAVMERNLYAERAQCDAAVLAKFPWVDRENLSRIYSQGQYYANK